MIITSILIGVYSIFLYVKIVRAKRTTMVPAKVNVQGAADPRLRDLITYRTMEVNNTVPNITEKIAKIKSTNISV